MRIDRLVLDSFGAFQGVTVDFGPGLNFFFGENEDGKSTLIDGLLLTMLGAPAHSDRRQRYAPLDRRAYTATVYLTTADGRALRIERNLSPSGQDKIGVRVGETWVVGKKSESGLKDLVLPPFELARSTVVIGGSEVVLAGKSAGTVSKAISARATRDESAISGQQALKCLNDRRILLENKERKAIEEELALLQRQQADLAKIQAVSSRLEETRAQVEERLTEARALEARLRPAADAFERYARAQKVHDDCVGRHTAVFEDLRAIRKQDEAVTELERALAALSPKEEALSDLALARFHQLAGLIAAWRETAAQHETDQLQNELALLKEKHAMYQRAGFTAERQRELDRIDGAVNLAAKNLAEKEAALDKIEIRGGRPLMTAALTTLAILAGLGAGAAGFPLGWPLAALAAMMGVVLYLRHGRRAGLRRVLGVNQDLARKEVELAQAAFLAASGGRTLSVWQEEFASARRLLEEIRLKEAWFEARATQTRQVEAAQAEMAALLTAAGCADGEEFIRKTTVWRLDRRRLTEAISVRQSLLRGKEPRAWEEEEFNLAREEAAAKAALTDAEKAAAGLDPAEVVRYREELAALDLTVLEREAAMAAAACAQHNESVARRDAWEIETGLALAEAALTANARRAEAVRLAMEVLGQAVAEVQGSLVPRIEQRAGRLFARLTGGRYEGLTVTSGPEMLDVSPRLAGAALPEHILSSGTADQMYLALRLALAEALQEPDPLPLILDDPFLTFDRRRLGLALALLLELAGENQIILVTKDEILRDLAREAAVRVLRLPEKAV